jgi:hypothetical protein
MKRQFIGVETANSSPFPGAPLELAARSYGIENGPKVAVRAVWLLDAPSVDSYSFRRNSS